MKKAQADIMGLVVIVILFIIIAVIFIALSGNKNTNTEFTQNTKASNILSSIIQFTPENCEFDIQDLIRKCTNTNIELCSNLDCEKLIERESKAILDLTTDKDTYQLTFKHEITNSPLNNLKIGSCKGPLRIGDTYNTRDFQASLLICR